MKIKFNSEEISILKDEINSSINLINKEMKEIEDDVVQFGHIDDGSQYVEEESKKPEWVIEFDHEGQWNNYSNF